MKPYFEENGITIYQADCRELLPEIAAELVLSDPPYRFESAGGGFYGDWASRTWGHADHSAREYIQELDELGCAECEPEQFLPLLCAPALVLCSNKSLLPEYLDFAKRRGFLFDLHVMVKSNPIPAKQNHFLHDLEYLIVMREPRSYFFPGAPFDTYRKVFPAYNDGDKLHPAEKPVGLMAKYITVLCPERGLVLDPFMGSGTTLVAAKRLGRRAVGIEVEERFCEVAAMRLAQGVLAFE